MGQHDPLDGLITYVQLKIAMGGPALEDEIGEMTVLCRGKDWTTNDPLGIGMLLADAYRIMQMTAYDSI